MITNGFTYFATLVLIAGILVGAQKLTRWKFFEYVPPVVLLYLIGMLGCTFKLWDTAATKDAYSALRNPILYAMIFVMLLRCDIRQILKLGPKMLLGFFTATITIAIGFVVTYALMNPLLGEGAWRGLGALCGMLFSFSSLSAIRHLRIRGYDISPGSLDSSFCFIQPGISHDVLCI